MNTLDPSKLKPEEQVILVYTQAEMPLPPSLTIMLLQRLQEARDPHHGLKVVPPGS